TNTIERIVVMFHRPLWGANPARVLDEYEPMRAIFHDLFVENGVDIVFNGHDHMFYHTVRNGTNYVITGGATQALGNAIPEHPYVAKTWLEDDYSFSELHICLVEVNESSMNVKAIVTNGTVVYEFTVDAEAPDLYSPVLNSPDDIQFTEGTSGNTISWVATDLHPGNYTILQDGETVIEGNWSSGIAIEYSLDTLTEGDYNFTIIVRDEYDHWINDTVLVQVLKASEETTTTTQITTTSSPQTTSLPGIFSLLAGLSVVYYKKKSKE
ncbi:MAG: hypothetical protein ACTSR2_07835, partial [Candidatus Hodarchaeales archaeon]